MITTTGRVSNLMMRRRIASDKLFFFCMCYEEITCPRCSSLNIIKNGRTANHKQRYLCKDCRRQFITRYTYKGCLAARRQLVLPMTLNSSGIRDIARVLEMRPNTVLAVLRQQAAGIAEPAPQMPLKDVEV